MKKTKGKPCSYDSRFKPQVPSKQIPKKKGSR